MPINEVFRVIKDQPLVARPKPIVNAPTTGPRAAEYCSFHDGNGHRTVNCRHLQRYLEELVRQGHLKEFVLYITHASCTIAQLLYIVLYPLLTIISSHHCHTCKFVIFKRNNESRDFKGNLWIRHMRESTGQGYKVTRLQGLQGLHLHLFTWVTSFI